jgi:hypothetical protein
MFCWTASVIFTIFPCTWIFFSLWTFFIIFVEENDELRVAYRFVFERR